MPKHRTDLTRGVPLPSTWVNSLMEFVGTQYANFRLRQQSPTAVSVRAGSDNDQASIAVGGAWRYVESTVSATHPGGAAGTYDVWVTAAENDLSAVDPADATDYSFGVVIRARVAGAPSPPAAGLSRRVGEVLWNGTAIVAVASVLPGTDDTRWRAIPGLSRGFELAGGDNFGVGTQIVLRDGTIASMTAAGTGLKAVEYLDAADFEVGGRQLEVRLRVAAEANAVAVGQTVTCTFGFVASLSRGGSGVGVSISGPSGLIDVNLVTPPANAPSRALSAGAVLADFPASYFYVGVSTSGALAAGSRLSVVATPEYRLN
jgi:hypothetical protein